jgi:hypothetical protein
MCAAGLRNAVNLQYKAVGVLGLAHGCEGVVDAPLLRVKGNRFARLLRVRLDFLGQFVRAASESQETADELLLLLILSSLMCERRGDDPPGYGFAMIPNKQATVEASKIPRDSAFRVSAEVGNFALPLL